MAAILGVTPNTITEWVKRGCPLLERGSNGREYQFDTAAVIQWRMDCLQAELMGREGAAPDFERDRARKMQADADLAEVERDLARASVVRMDDVAEAVTAEYATVRARLQSLPGSLAPRIDTSRAREIEPLIAAAVNEVLEELASDERYADAAESARASADDPAEGSEAEPAPEPC